MNESASPIKHNWIFVTGAIRSGTTFVGTVLSFPLEVDYFHEPFNPQCGIPGIDIGHRYIRSELSKPKLHSYHSLLESIFNYRLTLKNHIPETDPWRVRIIKKIFGSRGPFYLRLAKINPKRTSTVIKDPIGLLLTEYLYLNYCVKPVIIIKHPVSFIASLKRVNWWPSPSEIFDQEDLVEDYFHNEIDFVNLQWSSKVAQSAAFWRSVHKILLTQSMQYPSWQIITHEKLSQYPLETFKELYHRLNLPWSKKVEKKIVKLTQGQESSHPHHGRVQDFNRNSSSIFKDSFKKITLDERREIFEITQDIACQIYSRESFMID